MSKPITFPEQTDFERIRRILFFFENTQDDVYFDDLEEADAYYCAFLNQYEKPDCLYRYMSRWVMFEVDTVESLFQLCLKNRSTAYFYLTYNLMSMADCCKAFTTIWPLLCRGEFNHQMPKQKTLDMLQSINRDCLMDEDELEEYDSLPDELTIYRDVEEQNPRYVKSFAWTTNLDHAKSYAKRFCFHPDEPNFVYEARISKKDIFAVLHGSLVVNYKKLKDVHPIWQTSPEDCLHNDLSIKGI